MDDRGKKWVLILCLLGYVLFSFFYYWIRFGKMGVSFIIGKFISNILWLTVIGIVVVIIYFLFLYERKIDANYEVYQGIIMETSLVCPPNLGYLIIGGDKEHSSVKLGRITGLSIRSNCAKDKNNSETIFRVKKTPDNVVSWVISLFSHQILIRCPSNLHDVLHGDVSMKCTSLVKHGLYFYPNVIHLQSDKIDETIYSEAERFVQLDLISKVSPLIYRGIGLTAQDMDSFKPKTGMDIYGDLKKKAGYEKSNVGG